MTPKRLSPNRALSSAVVGRLKLLGLDFEPFAPKKVNVFSNEALPNLTLVVDGFQRLSDEDAYITSSEKEQTTAFFAVVGQTGTGRSAAAKYILEQWRRQRGVDDAKRFIVPVVDEMHHDDYGTFTTWLSDMSERASEITRIPAEIGIDLIQTLTNQTLTKIFANQYRGHATKYGKELRAAHPKAAFAVCLEDIPDKKYLKSTKTIFEMADTLCVCTMTPAVAATVDFEASGWNEIRLEALEGDEAAHFIAAHWEKHTEAAIPFEPEIVREAFSKRLDVIARVRALMSDVLISKLTFSPDVAWDRDAFNRALEKAEAGVP